MSSIQGGADQSDTASSSQAADSGPGAPNQYHLHGRGISVHYFPDGFGPVQPGGVGRFTYQDSHRSMDFHGEEIRTVEVPDLGTVVSVSLAKTVDTGFTAFSVLLPDVFLPEGTNISAPIETRGIATIHRTFASAIGHAQREVYSVTRLSGTAVRGMLPM